MHTFANARAKGLRNCLPVLAFAAVLTAAPARADLEISSKPTKNVSCTGGACVATAKSAVMNVADLTGLLGSQPSVSLDAGPAKDIRVEAAFSWVSGNALSLTAPGALTFDRPVTVASKASVTIHSASLVFADKASLTFWDLASPLTINGHAYTLVGDLPGLWNALWGGSDAFTAFARDYDASGESNRMPIASDGVFEGLGHTISNIPADVDGAGGLIQQNSGRISNIHVGLHLTYGGLSVGLLVDTNSGTIDHASATGGMQYTSGYASGGLVGSNGGTISNSHARVKMGGQLVGGLVGINTGTIESSYAEGSVGGTRARGYGTLAAGGLVCFHAGGQILNSFSTVRVRAVLSHGYSGSLIGFSNSSRNGDPTTYTSYAAGEIADRSGRFRALGGVIGGDEPQASFADTYWNLDKGVSDPARGAGDVPNAPGITGLSDAQLKSGLPAGFDPKVWGQNASINNGYPYLLANPPQ